ncbi:hypothetical protein CYLTODRAFT_414342 [Cylindrobasidium torrendii FP15055 ss-10]|uniref:Uncharacterized protein n=1 Tax=Cylindrobasidium torrendii FP15055 ss-10 TaxID=1314674 RepID=A0A0D7AYN7_9AGAR|nr:hypothetical protein CYLTODRAFT_414342 [Cylindrobasidium torrendii FP15055 ss-10]
MVCLGNISARVVVDGVGLPEYAPRYDAERRELSCWIPSEPGKEFKVFLKRKNCDYHGSASFSVNGVVIRRQLSWRGEDSVFACDFMRTRTNSERPLLFSRMPLPDSAAHLNTPLLSPQHGDIRIRHGEVHQAGRMECHQPNPYFPLGMARDAQKPAPHFTQLGQQRGISNYAPSVYNESHIEHLITVIFRYRPLVELQASGIAPRFPSGPLSIPLPMKTVNNVPLSRKRKASSADLDSEGTDLEELEMELEVKRLELRIAWLLKQKRKKARLDITLQVHAETSPKVRVKAERGQRTLIAAGKGTPAIKKERL